MKFLSLLFLVFFLSCAAPRPGDQDHFSSFSDLKQKTTQGVDYEIVSKNNNSKILVMAFHGGHIESGSTELAEEIAGERFNFYTFKALRPGKVHKPSFTSSSLHITSIKFDEPLLNKMASENDLCLGLHGFKGTEADFCVGGANEMGRKKLVSILTSRYPEWKSCDLCCPPFNGVSLKNPVNKCRHKGVQVEMSAKIRKKILADEKFKKELALGFVEFLEIK